MGSEQDQDTGAAWPDQGDEGWSDAGAGGVADEEGGLGGADAEGGDAETPPMGAEPVFDFEGLDESGEE